MTRHVVLSLLLAACVALSTLVLGPSIGGAQPSGAPSRGMDAVKKQMERGQELYMQKKYDEAATAFAAAYAIQRIEEASRPTPPPPRTASTMRAWRPVPNPPPRSWMNKDPTS